ncbi:MAG: hypothetical protein WBW16_03305 [Bacteroidota bacterium]
MPKSRLLGSRFVGGIQTAGKEPKQALRNRELRRCFLPTVRGKRFPLTLKNSGEPSAPSDRFPNARIALLAPAVDSAQRIQIAFVHPKTSGILREVQTHMPSS